MRAVDERAADCPDGCAETLSVISRPAGILSRREAARLRQTKASDALTIHRQITAATRRDGINARRAGRFHLAPTALELRVGRAA
jgi:hypothetical protein